jgi:hypothetical protein
MQPWLTHHFRITLFSANSTAVQEGASESLFETIFAVPVDSDESRGNKSIRRRVSVSGGRHMELIEQPFRVDASWVGPTPLEAAPLSEAISESVRNG